MSRQPIRDNALHARLRTPEFKQQQHKAKKGKGSYKRQNTRTRFETYRNIAA